MADIRECRLRLEELAGQDEADRTRDRISAIRDSEKWHPVGDRAIVPQFLSWASAAANLVTGSLEIGPLLDLVMEEAHQRKSQLIFCTLDADENGVERPVPHGLNNLCRVTAEFLLSRENAPSPITPEFWRELASRFRELLDLGELNVIFTEAGPGIAPDSGLDLKMGLRLMQRYRSLATQAGVALGTPPKADPIDYWLEALRGKSPFFSSMLQKSGSVEYNGGYIRQLALASAEYCEGLESRAFLATRSGSVASTPARHKTEEEPAVKINLVPRRKRLDNAITSPTAARKMEAYMEANGGQTEFAKLVGTTDRTLRSFRKTGRISRPIFDAIAGAMAITPAELMRDD